jgi:NTE family protein
LEASDAFGLLDLTLGQAGFVKGDRLLQRISQFLPDKKIEDLPIRYTAVATDILRQREVWFQKGSIKDAVRASIAIPTVFTPFKFGDTYLLDGGILNPIPISPTLADTTDLTVVVNLSAGRRGLPLLREAPPIKKNGPTFWKKALTRILRKPILEPEDLEGTMSENIRDLGLLELWGLTVETMRSSLTRYKMAGQSPDIVIDIPRDAAGTYDFHRAFELIELGRQIARDRIKDFEKVCGVPDESTPPSSPN